MDSKELSAKFSSLSGNEKIVARALTRGETVESILREHSERFLSVRDIQQTAVKAADRLGVPTDGIFLATASKLARACRAAEPDAYAPAKDEDKVRPPPQGERKPSFTGPALVEKAEPSEAELSEEIPEIPEAEEPAPAPDVKLEPARGKEIPKTRVATESEVETFARNLSTIGGRQREVLVAYMEQGFMEASASLGITVGSIQAYLSTLSTRIGIPRTHRFHPYNRMDALHRAWKVYVASSPDGLPAPPEKPKKLELLQDEERLVWLYRAMSSDDRLRFLEMGDKMTENPD